MTKERKGQEIRPGLPDHKYLILTYSIRENDVKGTLIRPGIRKNWHLRHRVIGG
jgi:hypothetical protein